MHRGKQTLFSTQSREARKVVTPYFSWRSLRLCVGFLINFCENNNIFGNNSIYNNKMAIQF